MDGFHLSNRQLEELGLRSRKGAPETFDIGGLLALLIRLRGDDRSVTFAPDYDRDLHEPIGARRRFDVDTDVVIVEGNYLLHDQDVWGDVRPLLDFAWYLDAPDLLREERLVARQVAGGRSQVEAETWVAQVDRPNAAAIARGRSRADRVLDSRNLDVELGKLV